MDAERRRDQMFCANRDVAAHYLAFVFCSLWSRNGVKLEWLAPSQGGIAQLVERQLCKLDVRGSNPLASMWGKIFEAGKLVREQRVCSSVG